MRIIGGKDRGRKLKTPQGNETRPTLDKVRGAIFNILFDVSGLDVLDMFGGSGAMGFEALSRGARSCVIIENNKAAFKIMEENKTNLFCGDSAQLRFSDFKSSFHRGECFDIIFLDPPYHKGLLEDALLFICERGLKKENGVIVAETGSDRESVLPETGLKLIKEKQYGHTKILFLK
ncbi:MAG TPA: 16S rRNA (guanine(966)-N(2))-methyltransferase RsmD [Clostridiales bacterium]|nr:16S rRNA (guanine(966)-N(2))-methyltransferase RsmD [Clostridiales bacterium]